MPVIAVVDDRKEVRDTLVKTMKMDLPQEHTAYWTVVDIAPLESINDYPRWILANNVAVLVLDERLHESAPESELSVTYLGHEVVDVVRRNFRTLPIWVVTSYDETDDLQECFSEVEGIVSRKDLHEKLPSFISRFIRSGTKFFEDNRSDFERLAELARKIALGEATAEDVKEAEALQMYKAQPLEPLIAQSDWLAELEKVVAEFADIHRRIDEHLREKNALDKN